MTKWLHLPITGDLKEVPFIGDGIAKMLRNPTENCPGISSTFELLGKFLQCRGAEDNQVTQCDRFWAWLKSKGIGNQKNSIVQAVAMKSNIYFPGMYDEAGYKSV